MRNFLKNNIPLVMAVFLVAWCIMWLAIGVQPAAFWWFMLGVGVTETIFNGLDAWYDYRTDKWLNEALAEIQQRYADREWDSEWEPTADDIANIDKGYN